jgi:hypothetical protein
MDMPSPTRMRASISCRALVVLSILLLAAHAPLVLNDGIFMDDWLLLKLRQDCPVDLSFLVSGAGHPVFFGYYSIANMTGAPVAVMVIMTVLAVLAGAICLALAAVRCGLLSRAEAIGVALLVWTYPGYQMWAGKANAVYVFSFGLFCVATWLLTLAFDARGARHAELRIVAALAFFLSFALNSLMALYLFAMFGLFVAVWRANGGEHGPIRRLVLSAWRCAAGYPEFVVLPLVYWGALNIWFKRVGAYAGYYGIHLPKLSDLRGGWNAFFQMGCMNVLARAGQTASNHWLLLTLIIGSVVIVALMLCAEDAPPRTSVFQVALPLLLGVLLFFALSMPYLIAGIQPTLAFYETRHLLLFGLPGALLVLAVKRLVQGAIGDRAALVGVFGLASIVSIAALWNSYVFLQARALKQGALSSHLTAMPMPNATVFDLVDGFEKYSPRFAPFGIPEVSGMLRLAWGDHPFFGFSFPGERPTILREMESAWKIEGSAFRSMDPYGPQATIWLEPGPAAAPDAVLVRHYYACRLLARCDVAALLTQFAIVKVDVGPIAGVLPLLHSK